MVISTQIVDCWVVDMHVFYYKTRVLLFLVCALVSCSQGMVPCTIGVHFYGELESGMLNVEGSRKDAT